MANCMKLILEENLSARHVLPVQNKDVIWRISIRRFSAAALVSATAFVSLVYECRCMFVSTRRVRIEKVMVGVCIIYAAQGGVPEK